MTIALSNLSRDARAAFEHGIRHLLASTLPSAWDNLGCGWQEHWEEASFAGFYASCDGLLLLSSKTPAGDVSAAVTEVVSRVYGHHLCPFLDESLEVDADKQHVRKRCLGTTMKLAKFVQASAALPDTIRRKELYDRARQMLIQIGHQGSGLWSATLGTEMPRYSATCEGLLALAVSDQRAVQETLRSGYSFLLNTLQSDITAKWKIVLLWTLVEISLKLGEPPPSQVVRLSREILPLIDTLDDALVVEYFPTVKGDSDFYHFNVNLLGARATVDLYQLDLLDESYLRFAIPIVASIAENIGQNGRYRTPAQDAQPRFWEHYQAMSLLGDFCRLMEAKSVASELAYMWISPRHFEPRTFLIDDKLAVVLMPLSTDWSNDVYKAISEVKKIGETTYRYWRSDLRFQDDKIMQSIWEEINRARFIVADCTGRNPNVFYELGIAHTIGKSVFICAQNRADIPFDLAAIRSFEYGGATPTKLRGLKVALRKFLEDLR